LKKHLEGSGIRPGEGKLNEREYEKALASLKGVHTDDVVNEVLPGGAAVAEQMLDAIMSELKEYERSGKNLPVERFIDIMEGLREIALRYGIDMSSVRMADLAYSPASAYRVFMKEVLSQDTPVWGANAGGRFKSVLLNLGRIGVGFIPVVGDAVDLYEFLSGKDFLTGTQLTFGERVLTAAGLLAGSGKIWREVAGGIGETLDSAKLAKRVGKGSVNQSRKALNEAENLTGSVLKENGQVGSRRITVLGSRQDTLVARDWPRHNVLNLPEGKWSWAKNKQWLDDAIERGDEFYLATDPNKWRQIRPSSVYFDELEYLKSQEFIQEGNRMIRKKVTIQAPN
jgi:hypothetical protein